MKKPTKIEKVCGFLLMKLLSPIRPRWSTKAALFLYARWGMNLKGTPNYISSSCWFDGSDYSRITLGEGCTISSNVSFLTHDWSLHTIGRSLGVITEKPIGRHGDITIGDYAFIGRGSILMPNVVIGKGSVVGAGSVVRGVVPDYSIVVGNPSKIIGRSDEYFSKKTGRDIPDEISSDS